jgi:uncharacterized protein YerC
MIKTMPHVSKHLLRRKNFLHVHRQLFSVITELARSGETNAVLGELLTSTERFMLAKRLAIIVMLENGESPYAIWRILRVSPSTVERLSANRDKGTYKNLLRLIKKQDSIWSFLEKIAPPRVGRNRFKNFLNF